MILLGPKRGTQAMLAALLMTGWISAATAQVPYAPARDVVKENELRERIASARPLKAQLAETTKAVAPGKAPVVGSSLWSRSIILTDGEHFTLVPVGSVLHLPAELRSHVATKPQGQFTFWPNFLRRNSTWLAAHEVTLEMAKGDVRQAKAVLAGIAKDRRLLVAVYKGGPVTVLEPAPEEPASTSKP